jgi:hypothetical protein
LRIALVLIAVLVVTLPFGFYRAYTRRLSLRWFLAIHVPVVLVFLIRFESHLSYWFIPFTFLAFTAAQLLGGMAGRWWIARHPAKALVGERPAPPRPGLSNEP